MAIQRLQEVAVTDTAGAAAFIQKCFDRAGVAVKAKAVKEDASQPRIDCKGKVMGQDVHFMFILDQDGTRKRPDVYTDAFDFPSSGHFLGESEAIEKAWDAIHTGLKKKREVNQSLRSFAAAAKAAEQQAEELREFADWNRRMAKALQMISQGYGK